MIFFNSQSLSASDASVISQGTFRNAKGPTSVLVVCPNPQRALAPRHSEVVSGHTKQQTPGIFKVKAVALSGSYGCRVGSPICWMHLSISAWHPFHDPGSFLKKCINLGSHQTPRYLKGDFVPGLHGVKVQQGWTLITIASPKFHSASNSCVTPNIREKKHKWAVVKT